MLKMVLGQEENTIKDMLGDGEVALAPSMNGMIIKKNGCFYLICNEKEVQIPEDLLNRIKVRKENKTTIAYSE